MNMIQTLSPRELFMRIMTKVCLITRYKLHCGELQGRWFVWEVNEVKMLDQKNTARHDSAPHRLRRCLLLSDNQ